MAKSLLVAYILWFLFGTLGIHHLYLRRDAHCLLTIITFGGCFGFGWYRDFFRMKQYVNEANLEPQSVGQQALLMSNNEVPPFSTTRFSTELIAAAWLAYTVMFALPHQPEVLPEDLQFWLKALLLPLAIAAGVVLAGNIGWQQGSIKTPLIAAYVSYAVFHPLESCITYSSIVASLAFEFNSKRWKIPRAPVRHKPFLRRVAGIGAASLFYAALILSALYFNAKISWPLGKSTTTKSAAGGGGGAAASNKTVPFFQAVRDTYNSPEFRNFLVELTTEINKFRARPWSDVYKELSNYAGKTDEAKALKILNVTKRSTKQNITASYRKLARIYHPDKYRDPEAKKRAQEKFIEVQWAHELLVGGRGKKSRSRSYDDDDDATDFMKSASSSAEHTEF